MMLVRTLPLLGALAPVVAAQSVLVVDENNGPGTDFITLAAAISAAAEGDALLIRTGTYDSAVVDGKSLVLQTDEGDNVSIRALEVRNLDAGQFVSVSDVDILGCSERLVLQDNQGSVWLERCVVLGGVTITDCDSVVFTRCSTGLNFPITCMRFRFACEQSSVFLYGSFIKGYTDRDGGADGETAIQVTDGLLSLEGTIVQGGDGLDVSGTCPPGTDGGVGIELLGTAPEVVLLDTAVDGGTGCSSGPAPDIVDGSTSGTVTFVPGTARSLRLDSPVREFETLTLTYTGVPGDRVRLMYSSAPGPAMTFAPLTGVVLLGMPIFSVPGGTIDSSGTLVQMFTFSECGPGIEVTSYYGQPLFVNSLTAEVYIGAPVQLHLFDSSF